MKLRTRSAALLAVPALALGLAACSDDENATVVTGASEAADATPTIVRDDDETTTRTAAPAGEEPAAVSIKGERIEGRFSPVTCTADGGELDVDGGDDLEISLDDVDGTPVLDEMSVETDTVDFGADDDLAAAATVTRDGDTWTIAGDGKHDGSEDIEPYEITVVCPVR